MQGVQKYLSNKQIFQSVLIFYSLFCQEGCIKYIPARIENIYSVLETSLYYEKNNIPKCLVTSEVK